MVLGLALAFSTPKDVRSQFRSRRRAGVCRDSQSCPSYPLTDITRTIQAGFLHAKFRPPRFLARCENEGEKGTSYTEGGRGTPINDQGHGP